MLFLRPEALAGAALLRSMTPLPDTPRARLDQKPVLILSGAVDPIVPPEDAARLAAMLSAAGAEVQHHTVPVGHGLSQADVAITKAWLDAIGAPNASTDAPPNDGTFSAGERTAP
jgi:phospholipase/carboxylesterase